IGEGALGRRAVAVGALLGEAVLVDDEPVEQHAVAAGYAMANAATAILELCGAFVASAQELWAGRAARDFHDSIGTVECGVFDVPARSVALTQVSCRCPGPDDLERAARHPAQRV